jgi:hypothetical protein
MCGLLLEGSRIYIYIYIFKKKKKKKKKWGFKGAGWGGEEYVCIFFVW